MLDMILAGLSEALQLANLLFVLLGVIAGMIAGAIPGVNGPMAIALCIPLSYYMSPVAAIGFLVGLNKGAFFGGSISGVLLNTPGTPESAATTWDGYPLAKQGKGEKALRMALYASVTGDAFATLVLILVAAPLAAVALYMGPPEIFALICMAMTIIAGLGTRSLLRGFIAAALGVLIGTVGIEPVSALPRLTFDIVPLERGISLIPVGIGMLAFSEIIIQLEQQLGRKEAREVITFSSKPEDRFITLKEYVECLKTLIRSSIAGTVVGALPGLGAPVASFFAYDQAVKHSKEPETFGKGRLEGIAASESANSAVVASSLIPLFTLGIPGNMAAALLIGAFVVHGMIPGPTLFEEQGNILYAIMLGLIVVNVFMYILGSGFTRFYAHITRIPYEILAAIVLTFCIAGAYSTNNRMYDIYIILIFGIVAYFLRRMDFQLVPILLGIVLGPLAEKNFRRALVLSDGSLDIFFTRPISCAFILIAVGSILLFAWKNHKAKVKNTQK